MLTLGFSYLSLGYYLAWDKKFPLSGPLYFLGSLYVLVGSYGLGGLFNWRYGNDNLIWKTITAFLILATFLFSVPLHSKALLYVGAFFLVFYLTDISSSLIETYGSYRFPLLLIVLGLLLMCTGYVVFHVRKRISRKNK